MLFTRYQCLPMVRWRLYTNPWAEKLLVSQSRQDVIHYTVSYSFFLHEGLETLDSILVNGRGWLSLHAHFDGIEWVTWEGSGMLLRLGSRAVTKGNGGEKWSLPTTTWAHPPTVPAIMSCANFGMAKVAVGTVVWVVISAVKGLVKGSWEALNLNILSLRWVTIWCPLEHWASRFQAIKFSLINCFLCCNTVMFRDIVSNMQFQKMKFEVHENKVWLIDWFRGTDKSQKGDSVPLLIWEFAST
jgi:hypothetical protein